MLASPALLTACGTRVNLKVPSYPSRLEMAVSTAQTSQMEGPLGYEYSVPESQVRYMNWSILQQRWLNIDAIIGRIHRAVRDNLGENASMLKGCTFDEIFRSALIEAMKLEPAAAGLRLVPQVNGSGVTLFTLAKLSLTSVVQAGVEFQLAARDAAASGSDGLNRNFFYVPARYRPLRADGGAWLDNQAALIKQEAAVAYGHLARLYMREVTGQLGKDLEEAKLRKVAWPSATRPGEQDYGLLVEASATHAVVMRVHGEYGGQRRDWGVLERYV